KGLAHHGELDRRPVLARYQLGELHEPRLDVLRQRAEDLGPLGWFHPWPRAVIEGGTRGVDRGVNVARGPVRDSADDLLCTGRHDLDPPGACRLRPLAANEGLVPPAHVRPPWVGAAR